MRRRSLVALLIYCLTLLGGASAIAQLVNPIGQDSNFVLHLPSQLVEWAEASRASSPGLTKAERTLELARSQYRAAVAGVEGSTLLLDAPFEVNQTALGAGVQLNLRSSRGSTVTTATLGLAHADPWDKEATLGPVLAVRVTHPLGGGTETELKQQAVRLAEAEAAYTNALGQWQIRLLKAYAALHLTLVDAEIAGQQLAYAEERLEVVLLREQRGASSPSEVYSARLAVTKAEADALKAQMAFDRALYDVIHLTGVQVERESLVIEAEPRVGMTFPQMLAADTEEEWVAHALNQRSDIRLADERVALAELALEDARREAGFKGELKGGITFPERPQADDPTLGWYVGAAFSLPLHDPLSSEAVLQAEVQLEQALADRTELVDQIRAEVTMAYRELQVATELYMQLQHELVYAERLVALAQEAWENGLGTELEVKEAAIARSKAVRSLLAAEYDVMAKRATLWQLVGGVVEW